MTKDYIEERDGNFYVVGTRISLDSIVDAFRREESPETICRNFELLSLEEVYGAIAYYLANQAVTDGADLRERLMRARDRFSAAVREGIAQADRGELIDDDDVRLWLERQERSAGRI